MSKEPQQRVRVLERALEAALRAESAEVLAQLLAHWRMSRSPEVAQLIDRLPEVDRTHEAIFSQLRSCSVSQAQARMERLHEEPEDPRTAKGLLALLADPPFDSGESADFWELVLSRLVQLADVRVASEMRAIADANSARPQGFLKYFFEDELSRARNRLWSRLSDRTEGLESAELAILGRLRARVAPAQPKTRLDLLWERIVASPEDLEARLIYADALMERGDPSGEFIALQCSRSEEAEPSERERALLQAHGRKWLGRAGLLLNVEQVSFVRGAAVSADLGGQRSWLSRGAPVWEWALSEPLWATVGRLELGAHFPAAPIARLLKTMQGRLHSLAIEDVQVLNPDSRFRRQLDMRSMGVSTLELAFTHSFRALRGHLAQLASPFWSAVQTIVVRPNMVHYLTGEGLRGVLEALCAVARERPTALVVQSGFRAPFARLGAWLEAILELRPQFSKVRLQTQRGALVLEEIRAGPVVHVVPGEDAEVLMRCASEAGVPRFSSAP